MNMKKIFLTLALKEFKEKERKKNRKKGKNRSATMIMVILEFSQFQVLHMESSWEKFIFNCSYLVAMFYTF